MNFGEKLEVDVNSGVVCGEETGRVVATFSHVAEAESFVELYNDKFADLVSAHAITSMQGDKEPYASLKVLAEIREILGVGHKPMMTDLPDILRQAMQGDSEPVYQVNIRHSAWKDITKEDYDKRKGYETRIVYLHDRVKGVSDERAEFEKEFNPSPDIYLDDKTGCYLAKNSHHVVMAADKQRHWEGWQARSQLSTNPDGYVSVPIEPTEAMKRALFTNLANADDEAYVIKAIIAAAISQPKGE